MTYFSVISEGWELSTETHAKERSGLQNTFFFSCMYARIHYTCK